MTERAPSLTLSPSEDARIRELRRLVQAPVPDVSAVLELLTDPSWAVRREVVRALGEMGTRSVAPLCALLRERRDDEARIAAAVDALVASSVDVLWEVSKLATDADPAVAADGAQILGRRRNTNAISLLADLVAQSDDNVAVAAIEALGRIGGPQAIEALIFAVQSGNFFRTFPAIDVLGRSGDPRAIHPLARLLPNSMYTLEVARALGRTGEAAAIPHLAGLLQKPGESLLRVAAVALAEVHARHREQYGSDDAPAAALRDAEIDPSAVGRLLRSLSGASVEERTAIAFILGVIGGEAAAVGLRGMLDLGSPTSDVASASLKRLGNEAEHHVRSALLDGDSARRRALLQIVARATAAPEVVECLSDPDPLVRALACEALGRIAAGSSVPIIFPLIADASQRVVHAAIGAIQSLGSAETTSLALTYAKDENPARRIGAMRILGYFGAAATLPAFLEGLSDEEPRVRDAALMGLALIERPEALKALFEASAASSEQTRATAMRALGRVTQDSPRIAEHLLPGLDDPAPWVRYYACQALGHRAVESAAPRLSKLLSDDAGQVRVAAIEALSHMQGDGALEALHHAAVGNEPDMQRAALIGLGLTKRPEALAVVLKAAESSVPSTRLVALSALANMPHASARAALTTAVRDVDENVRTSALGFLAEISAPEGTAALVELLANPEERERVIPLLSITNQGRVSGIFDALKAAHDDVAIHLASALARINTPESIAALLRAIELPWVPARKAAAASIASLRQAKGIDALRRAADHDPDPQVRQICLVLLGE